MKRSALYGSSLVLALAACAFAEPKPVPGMQALPQPHAQISFQREGVEIARYHFAPEQNRPFVFPIIGPSGRSLTRMGHPRDPESHSHHNSVWISHQSVNGVSLWEDRTSARIAHVRVLRLEDEPKLAFVETENSWNDKAGKPLLRELRRTGTRLLPNGEWMLEIDLQFEAQEAEVTLGQTPFGIIGVRMAKTIGVHDGGGTIRNSEGGVNEVECFRKPARWCDYSGPITETGAIEGITLMDHPMNLHHPVPFHVREDGWMGAALTFPAAHVIRPGEPLRLRYALYIHAGAPPLSALQARWEEFTKSTFEEFKVRR